MKYFIDTEFIEGEQTVYHWGLKTDTWLRLFGVFFILVGLLLAFYFQHTHFLIMVVVVCEATGYFLFCLSIPSTPPTIDLISIGIVAEDGREYYAISKDFNLKEAWNRYNIKPFLTSENHFLNDIKVYWLRENVLKPIWEELHYKQYMEQTNEIAAEYQEIIKAQEDPFDFYKRHWLYGDMKGWDSEFTYSSLKKLIKIYGVGLKQIAEKICLFIDERYVDENNKSKGFIYPVGTSIKEVKTTDVCFYAYYADYDWVAFCWIFGKMIDLPKGFPKYCRDLKQTFDEKAAMYLSLGYGTHDAGNKKYPKDINEAIENIKSQNDYPKQKNEHNALDDARWNFELFQFLKKI